MAANVVSIDAALKAVALAYVHAFLSTDNRQVTGLQRLAVPQY
jgi:hypothetical protein